MEASAATAMQDTCYMSMTHTTATAHEYMTPATAKSCWRDNVEARCMLGPWPGYKCVYSTRWCMRSMHKSSSYESYERKWTSGRG